MQLPLGLLQKFKENLDILVEVEQRNDRRILHVFLLVVQRDHCEGFQGGIAGQLIGKTISKNLESVLDVHRRQDVVACHDHGGGGHDGALFNNLIDICLG